MRELIADLLGNRLSRRGFIKGMTAVGFTAAAIGEVLANVETADTAPIDDPDAIRNVTATGGELWVDQLQASGVEYVFANPGSAETGLYDAMTDRPGIQLIMGLHEGIVISMADAYHRVTGKPAFVNVHAMPGTAQMGGQLYNAQKARSAVVVTAGFSDNTVFSDSPGLGPAPGYAQADVTKPVTKLAWDVRRPESIPLALRRAFKVASAPPGGPVYLAISTDAQRSAPVSAQIIDQSRFAIPMRPRPDRERVELVARRLIEGRQPLLVVDPDLQKSGAVEATVALVDLLGLAVLDPRAAASTNSGFPNQHPLYWDGKVFGGANLARTDNPYDAYDVVVGIGTENIASGRSPDQVTRAAHAWKAVVGVDVETMGRTAPFELSVVADPKVAVEDLLDAVKSLATEQHLATIRAERAGRIAPQVAAARQHVEQEVRTTFGKQPMHPAELAMAIDRAAESDALIVNENLSHDFSLRHAVIQHYGGAEKMRIGSGGGSLGWGIGAAMGAKVGDPDRQVMLNIGDGSVMYSASGFWTMVRYEIPVVTVVWNNHNYQTVRHGFSSFGGKMAETGHYAGMHLGNPDIDFVGLAKSQGVDGERVEVAADLAKALERATAATRAGSPYLIDAVIDQVGGGAGSSWYQTFSVAKTRTRRV